MNGDAYENNDDYYKVNNEKTKLIGSTSANHNTLDREVVVPSKYLTNFWRSLDLGLIHCKIEVALSWSRDSVMFEISRTEQWVEIIQWQHQKQLEQHFK